MAPSPTDRFTLSIIENALTAASEEMFTVTARSARSPIIHDVLDFSTAITDVAGNVIAQALAVPVFVGVLDFNVKAVIAHYGADLHPGDVVILNDPYISGTHLNDVAVVMPIFFRDVLVGFGASKGHWNDIGGMTFGSWGPGRTEIYQEGLQIPFCKLYSGGTPNTAVFDIIRANTRLPDFCMGDLEAQVAGLRAAATRVNSIIGKYRLDTYLETARFILANGEQMAASRFDLLPKGHFRSDDRLDEVGPDDGPLQVHVEVEINDEEFRVDFSGNSPQLASSLNNTYPGTVAAVRVVYMALTNPRAKYNQGLVSRLNVIAPEGTIFNALRPAPVSVYWEVLTYAADLVWKALAPAATYRLTAGHFLSVVGEIVAGVNDKTREPFALVEPNPGGWGAGPEKDGESGLVSFADGETYASSVEVIENRYPILVDRYQLNIENGSGAGKHRGGFGIIKDYRILNSAAELTTDINRALVEPWAMNGGGLGTLNSIHILRDGRELRRLRKASALALERDDVISIRTGGGGGWGNPLDRDLDLVLDDLRNELITLSDARRIYGVVTHAGKLQIDEPATAGLRAEMREQQSAPPGS